MESSSFNLCNLPPWVIASRHFNEDPRPIEIQGVREANRFLFARLDATPSPEARAVLFHDYVSVKFQLHHWERQGTPTARRSLRNGYLRFLRGWGFDSSSIEGAVLKGWVESRIGLLPTFHRQPIDGRDGDAYMQYLVDRMEGNARTNAILSQLDLLYSFAQYELARRRPGERWMTLWRGLHDPAEQSVIEALGPREQLVRLNNLSSFTADRERAWEFGSTVWEAQIPVVKILCFGDLLPPSILAGEREVLVIGGETRVRRILF